MKKNKLIIIISIFFLLTGCSSDYYENPQFGEQVIESWFNYKDKKNDLGAVRRKNENISTIKNTECKFIEKDGNEKYIFQCILTYIPISETVIPLSKDKTLKVYAVFMPKNDNTFDYKVYNSKYKKGIWEKDPDIKYNEKN